VKSLAPSADTLGFHARSISDIDLIVKALELFKGRPPKSNKSIGQCKFAFVKTDQFDLEASDDLKAVWEQAKQILSTTGAEVEEVDLGKRYEGWMGPEGKFTDICAVEGAAALQRECVVGGDKVGEGVFEWFAKDITFESMLAARDELAILKPDFDSIVSQYDAIITPTVHNVASVAGQGGGLPFFGSLWTGLGVPTVHVPGFAGESGMPMGLTLVGARYKDQDLLKVARVVAESWIGADDGKLKRVPAPEGVVHLRP
jgi:amidase